MKTTKWYGRLADHSLAISLLCEQLSQRRVAEMFGVTPNSIRRVMKQYRSFIGSSEQSDINMDRTHADVV